MRLVQILGPTILMVVAVSIAAWAGMRARKHPNRAKKNPNRTRLPRFIVFIGALIGLLGLPTLATGLLMPESEIGPTIAGACMILGGAFFFYLYANWFVDVGPDRVTFRGMGRRVKTIWYSQIVKYRIEDANGRRSLMVKSSDGTVLNLNITMFDAEPLLQYIAWLEEQARAQAAREQQQRGAWGSNRCTQCRRVKTLTSRGRRPRNLCSSKVRWGLAHPMMDAMVSAQVVRKPANRRDGLPGMEAIMARTTADQGWERGRHGTATLTKVRSTRAEQ